MVKPVAPQQMYDWIFWFFFFLTTFHKLDTYGDTMGLILWGGESHHSKPAIFALLGKAHGTCGCGAIASR